MNLFKRCLIDDDLTVLVNSGNIPPFSVLQETWFSIYSEFVELTGGGSLSSLLATLGKKIALEHKIGRVTALIHLLRDEYSLELVQALKDSGYAFTSEDPADPAFDHSIAVIEAKLRNDSIKVQQLAAQLPADDPDKAKPKEEEFDATLIACEQYLGLQHSIPDTITTYKYCMYVQALRKKIDQLAKQNNERTNR